MPSRAVICLVGIAVCSALLVTAAQPARAANYKMVLCAGNNGSNSYATATNTISGSNPGGIFEFHNWCGPAPDPAGNNAYLRINENQSGGSAGETAYGSMSWTVTPWVAILAAGGYTREPNAFNDGWRGRFWAEDFGGGGPHNILMQGTGVSNGSLGGVGWAPTSTFASHLWPFSSYGSYRRFIFEMTCYRAAGCDRSNYNAVDANSFVLILSDTSSSQVSLTNTSAPFLGGQWVRGTQTVTYKWSDVGSGIRYEHVTIDGADKYVLDHASSCDTGYSQQNGDFARKFDPCPQGSNVGRSYTFDTASLGDGSHNTQVCTQDYAQWKGLNGTGGQSCDQRTIRTDNTAPTKPAALSVSSANPARYLDHFDASWSLPSDPGSPITKVHYEIVNAKGEVITPAQTVSATNPQALKDIAGPSAPGEYYLRLWLEDEVGFSGPAASVAIPHDTTPPAAPQDISVTSPAKSRGAEGIDVRWRNITDSGSPIDAVHYQVLDQKGAVAVGTETVSANNVEAIADLHSPKERGSYSLRMWLSDAEGNSGAPVSVPLAYQCVRSDTNAGNSLSSGLGATGSGNQVVQEGEGSIVHGTLKAANGKGVSLAPLCVFSRIVTDQGRQFLGFAVTGSDGSYRFPISSGASREISVIHRRDHREVQSKATLETVVHPTFKARRRIVYNKHFARFKGEIPGPHNDRVVIVLQARVGKGWTAFRRYRTRNNGRFNLAYRFRHTFRKTRYVMRAQVRQTVGYPYLQGNSRRLKLLVLPSGKHRKARPKRCVKRGRRRAHASAKHRRRCAKRHRAKRHRRARR